jgi:hypothetical protein
MIALLCFFLRLLACPWRIRKLRRDRHLEQTAAMVPPSVVGKDGMGGRWLARTFSRSTAIERLVNAIFVVIISELFQLSPQVPISRSTNGWDTGTYGIDLISSTSSMRKLASQRWKRNSGSWLELTYRGSDFPAMIWLNIRQIEAPQGSARSTPKPMIRPSPP